MLSHLLAVGARKLERDQILNTVVRGTLGAGIRCPVDRLGQYINSACSYHSHFTSVDFKFTSVQLSLAWLNSKQLPVSL